MSSPRKSDGEGIASWVPHWSGPRTVVIPVTEQKYGFSLQQYLVYPPKSRHPHDKNYSESDLTKEDRYSYQNKYQQGEPLDTIFVKHVKENSLEELSGLRKGDRILAVNDIPIAGLPYEQVIHLIQNNREKVLRLTVLPQEEDILQMAYKNTSSTYKVETSLKGQNFSAGTQNPSENKPFCQVVLPNSKPEQMYTSHYERERRMSASSVEDKEGFPEKMYKSSLGAESVKKMKTSTSYTSGLSIYREPQSLRTNNSSSDIYKNNFNEKRKRFEANAKENQPKTYSLGLYYPGPAKGQSSPCVEKPSVNTVISPYRKPGEGILQANDSQENIARASSTRSGGRIIPLEYKSPSKTTAQPNFTTSISLSSNPNRHSFPDSTSCPPHQITSFSQGSVDKYGHSVRQVPVASQASITVSPTNMSTSMDSLHLSASNQYREDPQHCTGYRTQSFGSPMQGSPQRTFIVKVEDKTGNNVHSSAEQSAKASNYGTTFALYKSPLAQIEIKHNDRPLVQQRKQQFEHGENEVVTKKALNENANRYKSEIKKITTQGKFTSVESRLKKFETNPDGSLRRMSSTDSSRYSSPEPSSGQSSRSQSEQRSTPQHTYQESAPIRIYVSQGASNNQGSPIVEILHLPSYQPQHDEGMRGHQRPAQEKPVTLTHSLSADDLIDGGQDSRIAVESHVHGNKPVRKDSFLAAVNAHKSQQPYSRYEEDSDNGDSEMSLSSLLDHPTTLASSTTTMKTTSYSSLSSDLLPSPCIEGQALTSTPIRDPPLNTVIFRKKSESTAEDEGVKLQRRTSYLMATAGDRAHSKLSIDKSISPPCPQSTQDVKLNTPQQRPSMRKLKAFFGERTPRIHEATEKKTDPASPLQEVIKEGTLYCKTDITDGKRSSDRSWRPVWVELRGHALYLHKEKKEPGVSQPFNFEDQPISIKSSMVDIAYDYTKKKNVFRLKTYNGSEYLFQADDLETMRSWISAIQDNNNPDSDSLGLWSADLIMRKTNQHESQSASTTSLKTSPQTSQKSSKKLMSLKQKIPSSPSIKRKKTDESKSKILKGKLKHFSKKHPPNSNSFGQSDDHEVTGMFGVPLECAIPSPNNEFVPMIVELCTKIVEARGLEVTGVYRVPGNSAAVNMMQEELNKGIDNMNVDHEKWCDVHVISSLLKAFFRKLPEPLVTTGLYQSFINANRLEDPEKRMLKIKKLLNDLPEHHLETFKHLAEHLNKVASMGHINKMDARNLALMFGPTLIRQNDDNMATIVQDMSDQCKIIESIILHNDWFFGSWDKDSYVPVDEEEDHPPSNPSISKMSCSDEDNGVNPKDIVSSIVKAANRKLRLKSGDDTDMDMQYEERDIDQEIMKHNAGPTVETARSSPNILGMISNVKEPVTIRKSESAVDGIRQFKSQEVIDSDWDFLNPNKHPQNMFLKSRNFSEDSLGKSDDTDLSPTGINTQYSISGSTILSLKQIEDAARILRQNEEKRLREYERHKKEKLKVEQDIQRTKKEIEFEDSQNVDDLLNASPHLWHSASDLQQYTTQMKESVSDYSSASSNASSRFKFSQDCSPISSPIFDRTKMEPKSGGKYFIVQSSKVPSNKRTNSVEAILNDGEKKYAQELLLRNAVKRREDKHHKRNSRDCKELVRRSRGNLSRSNSMRHAGSLDSLIDLYDSTKNEKAVVMDSSDSEDGSDLLSDLTSTFDQKLQVLVNPKYKLSHVGVKMNKSDSAAPAPVFTLYENNNSAHAKLPPQLPLSQVNKHGLYSSNDLLEKKYRDPSLHRSPSQKPEAKIGIACRFERNPANNSLSPSHSRDSLSVHPSTSTPLATSEPRTSYLMVNPTSVTTVENQHKSSSSYLNSPRLYLIPPSVFPPSDLSTMTKSEKTEVNISLSKQSKDKTSIASSQDSEKQHKARSESPEMYRKKGDSKKVKKRRHTVGGTVEEHLQALQSVEQHQQHEARKLSAWERLHPNVSMSEGSSNRRMISWIKNEHLRGSVPDLSASSLGKNM